MVYNDKVVNDVKSTVSGSAANLRLGKWWNELQYVIKVPPVHVVHGLQAHWTGLSQLLTDVVWSRVDRTTLQLYVLCSWLHYAI